MILNYLTRLYYYTLYLADGRFNSESDYLEKILLFIKVIIPLSAFAYLMNIVEFWFHTNKNFVTGFLVIVSINALFGWLKHGKTNTQNFEKFFIKTSKMLTVVIVTYILLSIVSAFAGDNVLARGFEILLQVSTLLYPAAKCLKSIHIWSDGDYPPEWLMKRISNFEKNGDLTALLEKKKSNENDQENDQEKTN